MYNKNDPKVPPERWEKFMSRFPNTLIVTCGDWDLNKMLPTQLAFSRLNAKAHQVRHWCNVKVCFESLYGAKGRGMVGMLESLNIPLEGKHHSGIDDCRNIGNMAGRCTNIPAPVGEVLRATESVIRWFLASVTGSRLCSSDWKHALSW